MYRVIITRQDTYDLSARREVQCRDLERVRLVLREHLRPAIKCVVYRQEGRYHHGRMLARGRKWKQVEVKP